MKFFSWVSHNILSILSLFLLAFIPLYPKLPIINVQHTWVYVRLEDFVVVVAIAAWVTLFLRKKVTLKTPLTLPILTFWLIGGVATLHGVLLVFPSLTNVFSNVALLSYLRRIEYMSLFFIAYSSVKDKKIVAHLAILLPLIMIAIVGYGFGQKFLGFPAYLTMNEEFAKGIPIQLSSLSRVPSTFGGQYDLAAYLVLMIPILVSLGFGFRNIFVRLFLLLSAALGFALLFLTVSRVSFFVLLLSLLVLLVVQRKKLIILSVLVLTIIFLGFFPSLLQRFGNTVSEVNVLVNAKSGEAIGQVKEVPAEYFKDKTIIRSDLPESASASAVILYTALPSDNTLVLQPNRPNGETLPQGTSYINLPLSPVIKRVGQYFYQKSPDSQDGKQNEVQIFFGDFVVKKAKAYDLSFTTRFQGEWPRTLIAFQKNIFLGSGYGSVSLAVDNDFLRLLGESGLFGFIAFASIFLIAGIYITKLYKSTDSTLTKSFLLGFSAGSMGLILNGIFIDVFEASKIAFVYWILMGTTLGLARIYKIENFDVKKSMVNALMSPYAIAVYLFVVGFSIYSAITSFYFVGDDYTWFKWAADCANCNVLSTAGHYLIQSDGFFYRPGTKMYFQLMYSAFWLNQTIYHFISILLHLCITIVLYLISRRIMRNNILAGGVAFLYLILSGSAEAVLWTAATGHLFNALFILLSLLFFVVWKEKKHWVYLMLSILASGASLLFHELGIVAPLCVMAYGAATQENFSVKNILKKYEYILLLFPLIPYFILRYISHSHWFNGDYSYNVLKFPFNAIGNAMGYFMLTLLGSSSLSSYEKIRIIFKSHVEVALLVSCILLLVIIVVLRWVLGRLRSDEKRTVVFGLLFFVITLIPFLGLGNITSRYSYLASYGVLLIVVIMLKRVYEYLLPNGKYITFALISIFLLIFSSIHLFQLQKTEIDWSSAGDKSRNVLQSLDYIYAHYTKEDVARLYFINVPIRSGEAWVFPVGLSDAVSLVFKDTDIQVHQVRSAEEAFAQKGQSHGLVFQFNDSGSLIELRKTKTGEIEPIKE